MRRRWWLSPLGLLAYLGALAVLLPAELAWAWFGDRAPVRAYGVEGRVWAGHATAVTGGAVRLDAVRWRLRPGALFTGRVAGELGARLGEGRLEGQVAWSPGGVTVSAARLALDVDTALALAGRQAFQRAAGGRLEALVRELVLQDGRPQRLRGLLTWNGARVGFGEDILLGDVALSLEPGQDGDIVGELSNAGGPLSLTGDLTVAPNGSFLLQAALAARDASDSAALSALARLGLPRSPGPHRFNVSGNLDGTGIRVRPAG